MPRYDACMTRVAKAFSTGIKSDSTALRGSAFEPGEDKPQVVSEVKDNFRKDDDVRWQWSGATWTTEGCPKGERGGVHQFGVPPKGNANFAWVQHFIHHLAPQGMAGFVLANGSMSSNQSEKIGLDCV